MKSQIKEQVRRIGRAYFSRKVGQRQDLALDNWHVGYQDRQLTLHGLSLATLAQKHDTPLHIVDLAKLENNYEAFSRATSRSGLACEVFLSYKTNPIPWTLSYLHERGAGAEVISEYELGLALTLGVPGPRIIYNGPAKSNASIARAITEEVALLNINHLEEIDRIRHIAAEMRKTVNVGLRIVGDGMWAGQFGVPVAGGQALSAFRRLLSIPEFNVVGVHCHRGTLMHTEEDVKIHAGGVLAFCASLKRELGFIPEIIDFGGSLGIPTTRYYGPTEIKRAQRYLIEPREPDIRQTVTPEVFAQAIAQAADDWFRSESLPPARIVIEPGRSLTGNTQLLLSAVVSLRQEARFTYAVMDAGVNIAGIMGMEFHQVFPVWQFDRPAETYRLVGPICHLGDTLHYAWRLPRLKEGDLLAIMDSGAYFVPQSNSFSFLRPAIIAVSAAGEALLIRHREQEAHIRARDILRSQLPPLG